MFYKYLKLFGLNPDSTLSDVKKAYKKLAKNNHPDHFINDEQKKKQDKIMARINEAYKIIINNFAKIKNEVIPVNLKDKIKKNEIINDYTLYKNGVEYYNIYFHGFFQLF